MQFHGSSIDATGQYETHAQLHVMSIDDTQLHSPYPSTGRGPGVEGAVPNNNVKRAAAVMYK